MGRRTTSGVNAKELKPYTGIPFCWNTFAVMRKKDFEERSPSAR